MKFCFNYQYLSSCQKLLESDQFNIYKQIKKSSLDGAVGGCSSPSPSTTAFFLVPTIAFFLVETIAFSLV